MVSESLEEVYWRLDDYIVLILVVVEDGLGVFDSLIGKKLWK